jgi:hypothetical protein
MPDPFPVYFLKVPPLAAVKSPHTLGGFETFPACAQARPTFSFILTYGIITRISSPVHPACSWLSSGSSNSAYLNNKHCLQAGKTSKNYRLAIMGFL